MILSPLFASQKAIGLPPPLAGPAALGTVLLSAAPRKAGRVIVLVLPHPVRGSSDPLPFALEPALSLSTWANFFLLPGLPTTAATLASPPAVGGVSCQRRAVHQETSPTLNRECCFLFRSPLWHLHKISQRGRSGGEGVRLLLILLSHLDPGCCFSPGLWRFLLILPSPVPPIIAPGAPALRKQ